MADLMESRCGSLPTARLTPHAEQFLSLLERKGIVPDQEITNEKARSADKALRKNMYHNTRQMLQHYRDIAWALECFPARVAEELDRPLHNLDALLTAVDAQLAMQNNRLEHRLECVKKSRLLMDRINEAITVLRQKPKNGHKMYDIIFQTYIIPEKLTHDELLYRLDISDRHYYRLRQQAINILSIRLWAAPSGSLDAWLEVLVLLEEGL